MPLAVTPTIAIPESELDETFIRASGPGGQNVNKVASAVQLRFNVLKSPSLPAAVKVRLVRLAGRRLTSDGVIVIEAKRFRDQARNREDARARLAALIARAATPEKRRIRTKVPRAQKKKRLEEKRRRGEVKARRKPPRD
ncbi:MAG: alternative ribosome rescue aminoacyl-tRNA hydrolase ArfB [Parvularculaceae bacterium]